MNKYSQKWYSDKLGTCNVTIKSHGCFVTCLAMLVGIEPPEVNELLTKNGGYSNGCMLLSDKASKILDLEYNGKTTKKPDYICIAETNYYKKNGVPQHFFVYNKGDMVDPLDQKPDWRKCIYPIVSYRLFKLKSMKKANQEFYDSKVKGQGWTTLEDWVEGAREYREERDNADKQIDKLVSQYRKLIKDQDNLNKAHDLELTRQKNALTTEFNAKLKELQDKLYLCEKLKDGAMDLAEDSDCKETIKRLETIIKERETEINKLDLKIAEYKKSEGIIRGALRIISNWIKKWTK
jgi:hypothetical protein